MYSVFDDSTRRLFAQLRKGIANSEVRFLTIMQCYILQKFSYIICKYKFLNNQKNVVLSLVYFCLILLQIQAQNFDCLICPMCSDRLEPLLFDIEVDKKDDVEYQRIWWTCRDAGVFVILNY